MLSQFLSDFTQFAFFRYALIGGVLIAAVCSQLSVYVVLRKMAFIGQGISHSALGGFALGIVLFAGTAHGELAVQLTALAFCLVVSAGIAATAKATALAEDSVIGIFFVASMACGSVLLQYAKGYNRDVTTYLFGSVIALTRGDVLLVAALSAAVGLPLLLLRKELIFSTFDETVAGLSGVRTQALHHLLLACLTVTIIISAKTVGLLLISAFLIMPGAFALMVARRFSAVQWASLVFAVASTVGGVVVALVLDWPPGGAIVLLQFAAFLAVLAARRLGPRAWRGTA